MPESALISDADACERGTLFGVGWRLVDNDGGGDWEQDRGGTHDAYQFGTRLVMVSRSARR